MPPKDPIYLVRDETDTPVRLEPTAYASEDEFQTLLERFPQLLAGEQIDRANPRRWLLVAREMGIANSEASSVRWSLDHLFVDQDGVPTLVEVNRQSDTRLRREVIGQVLEYAANAAKWWPASYLEQEFGDTCRRVGKLPDAVLATFLAQETLKPGGFWKHVEGRLKIGDMRLIFFSDMIPPELQRIVEFLNSQTERTEILAIEVQRYSGDGFSTHIPRLLGQTIEAETAKAAVRASSQRRSWDNTSFFAAIVHLPADFQSAMRQEYALDAEPGFSNRFGSGSTHGSYLLCKPAVGSHTILSLLTNGNLKMQFGSLATTPAEIRASDRLGEFSETVLGLKRGVDWRKQFPSVTSAEWVPKVGQLIEFLKTL